MNDTKPTPAPSAPKKSSPTVPVVAMIFGIVALAAFAYFIFKTTDELEQSTTNTTVTNTTVANANTNTAPAPYTYGTPTGPFSVANSKIFAAAYRRSTDRLVTRLAKVNASSGEPSLETELRSLDIQEALKLADLPNVSSFQFGTDGDSLTFMASGSSSGAPFTGIYRTSFTDPKKIETLVQYDRNNLFNNDIPSISSYLYHAESNQLAFVIQGESGVNNNYVKLIDLSDAGKTVRDLKSYTIAPRPVGFPQSGKLLEVLYADNDQYSEPPKDKWSYDQLRTSDGSVSSTKLVIDEASLSPPTQIYLTGDNIAPNNSVVAFTRYDNTRNQNVLTVRNLSTGKVNDKTIDNLYGGTIVWSPDSGKVVVRTRDGGLVYDFAKGNLDTIKEYGSGMLWYPGSYVLYTTDQNDMYSYTPSTKKTVKIEDVKPFGGYDGYGGPYGSPFSISWVNR